MRAAAAPASRHPAGNALWFAGAQYRPADEGDLRDRAGLERQDQNLQAQPLAGRADRASPAPGSIGAAFEAALHDAGQDEAAQLHRLRVPMPCRWRISVTSSTGCGRTLDCWVRRSAYGCVAAKIRTWTTASSLPG